jgi:hypothetical protein
MPGAGFQDTLVRVSSGYGIHLAESFRSALADDVRAVHARGTPTTDLVAILAFELCRLGVFDRELTKDDYRSVGGLVGILQAHLDLLFENLPDNVDSAIGWAVVREVVSTAPGRPTDVADLANRFDLDVAIPTGVLRWLEEDRHILRSNPDHGHDLVPGLLVLAVEARMRRDDEATEHQRWMLRQGLRHYAEIDALLPEANFRRVHQQRSLILASEDEACLMARSALSYKDPHLVDALDHWLRRVKDPDARAGILLEALFDDRPEVRQRAAARLRDVDRHEVQVQLQLLALRDPSEEVRRAAVDSLATTKDETLKASLRQDVADPKSPYRLQATEALRVFPDKDSVDTLVGIVGGRAETSALPVRMKAIEVLGAHGTRESTKALLDVAFHDPDEGDRAAAGEALARTTSQETASFVVESLREARHQARRLRTSLSWEAVLTGIPFSLAAVAAVAINFFIFGFILATLRRWRAAIAMVVAEVVLGYALISMVFASSDLLLWLALGLLLLLVLGFLVPTRILLLERQTNAPQTRYRRWLGGALFGFGCVTTFAVVHGLPLLLTRRIRRGLIVVGFEAGAFFLFSNNYLLDQLSLGVDGSNPFNPARYAPMLLTMISIVVLATAYLLGVGTVFTELFLFRDRRTRLSRIEDVWRHLVHNELVQRLLLDRFSGDAHEAKWGLRRVRRYRCEMLSQLRCLWDRTNETVRRRIFVAMATRPNADSVSFLKEHWRTLGLWGRLRYARALWTYRVSVWPKPILLVTLIAFIVLGLYLSVLLEFTTKSPMWLLQRVQGGDVAAAEVLASLTRSKKQHVSAMATTSLQLALSHESVRSNPKVLKGALRALPPGTGLTDLEGTIASILEVPSIDQESRSLVLTAVKQMGTALAAQRLRDFIQVAAGRDRSAESSEVDPAIAEALEALATMRGPGLVPFRTLLSIHSNLVLPKKVRDKAREISETSVDPLLWSEYYLQQGDFKNAIRAAQGARPRSGDTAYSRQVTNAIGRAYYFRGLSAIDQAQGNRNGPAYRSHLNDAITYMWAALKTSDSEAVRDGNVTLAERIVFELHETVGGPEAFEESYQILSWVEPIAESLPSPRRISLKANLAETALTAGHFEQAHRRALAAADLASNTSETAFRDTIVNMKVISFIALLLNGDAVASKQAQSDLLQYYESSPSGFVNEWDYTGTLQYVETRLPEPEQRLIQETIARVKASK